MGIEALMQQLKQVLLRITKDMKLPVNPDSEMYEEQENLPLERAAETWEYPEGPDIPEDRREEMPENRRREIRYRPPEVYIMSPPDRNDWVSCVPYLIIQFLSGTDTQTSEDKDYKQYATASVRVLIATWNPDGQQGGLQVVDLIERIRTVLLRGVMLMDNYTLQEPLDYEVYTDETGNYFLGEIDMVWTMPTIRRDSLSVEAATESGTLEKSGMIPERKGTKEDIWNEMTLRP